MKSGVHMNELLNLVIVLIVVLMPLALYRRGWKPRPPDPGGGDGWGKGPEPPRPPRDDPRGGIPLEDAEPARARLRENGKLADQLPRRLRRPAREPDRTPVRESTPS
jgi:hypothetical protein